MRVTGISTAKPTSMKIWLFALEAAACSVSCGGKFQGHRSKNQRQEGADE
jgi:hypothetical protein